MLTKSISEMSGVSKFRTIQCNYCKKEVGDLTGSKKYCSRACSAKAYNQLYMGSHSKGRKKKFKIPHTLYRELMDKQGAKCAICSKLSVDCPKAVLHVDHDHTSNKLRGLLCLNCNMGLGSFKDSVETLESAIKYLKEKV